MTSKNYIKNVAIIGAAGRMGGFIVKALMAEGKHKVTAITRHESTSPIPEGVAVKKVNYEDYDTLVEAFHGQDALIITMNRMVTVDTQIRLIEAAAAAGVSWIMPNWYGGDGNNEALSKDSAVAARNFPILKRIEELGKSAWVALACSFWYEWSLGGFMGMGPMMFGFGIKDRTLTFYDDGNTKINTTTWSQAGLAVARLFALKVHPDGPEDKSPTLSQFKNNYAYVSSFLVSQRDMFESLKRVTGTSDKDWTITSEPSAERYATAKKAVDQGDFQKGFAKMLYTRVMFPNGDGNYEAKYGLSNGNLGLPKEDMDEATKRAIQFEENPDAASKW